MNKYSENEDLSSWWLRVIILSLASLLCTASPGNAVAAPSSEVWVSGIEAPSTVYQGSSFTLSLSFKTTSPLTEECSFFIHLVGDGPGAYLNADINLPLPVK
jgi:hypothetical protein